MPTAHINIGSNLGNSRSIIEQAIAEIALLSNTPLRQSQFITSPPWGFSSTNNFLNVGVEIATTSSPDRLFAQLQRIQSGISNAPHRNNDGSYADRLIDIDLIYFDQIILNTPSLTLPHPRMHLRQFVLQPIAELAPTWQHPLLHLTAQQLLKQLQ
jgi:2-amino-4-hydroxy-6-hydroxymethyldihydropteridine diphosphokinase